MDVALVGLRALQPWLKVPGLAPYIEVELTGAYPMQKAEYIDREPHPLRRKSRAFTKPTPINPNFNGELLTIRGMVPLEPKLRLYLNVRVMDASKVSLQKMLGAAVLRLDTKELNHYIASHQAFEDANDEEEGGGMAETSDEESEQDDSDSEDESDSEDGESDEEESGSESEGSGSDGGVGSGAGDMDGIEMTSKREARRAKKAKEAAGGGGGADGGAFTALSVVGLLGIKAGRGDAKDGNGNATAKPPPPVKTQKELDAEEEAAVEKKRQLQEEERLNERLRKLEARMLEKQAFRRGRTVYDTGVEDVLKRLMSLPCQTLVIQRGTEDTEVKTVGRLKFQTKMRVLEPSWKDEKGMTGGFKLPPGDTFEEADLLRTKFAERRMLLVRVAVLRGLNLVPKDKNNLCDPYLVCSLGSKKQSHRKEYQKTTAQPQFYTTFEFRVELPGQADLRVAILDHDPAGRFLGDETIGETIIDLEDRWYSDEFQQMCEHKDTDGITTIMPIEMRQLYDPSGKYRISQVRFPRMVQEGSFKAGARARLLVRLAWWREGAGDGFRVEGDEASRVAAGWRGVAGPTGDVGRDVRPERAQGAHPQDAKAGEGGGHGRGAAHRHLGGERDGGEGHHHAGQRPVHRRGAAGHRREGKRVHAENQDGRALPRAERQGVVQLPYHLPLPRQQAAPASPQVPGESHAHHTR